MSEILDLFNKSKMAETIIAIADGTIYYSKILDYISRNFGFVQAATVHRRLKELTELGLVETKKIENRDNNSYHATERLMKIGDALKILLVVNQESVNVSKSVVQKFQGNSLKLLIDLPEEMRNWLQDDQELKTDIYQNETDIIIKLHLATTP